MLERMPITRGGLPIAGALTTDGAPSAARRQWSHYAGS